MLLEEEKIHRLMARKLAGEATADELAELGRLLASRPENVFHAELLQELWRRQPEDAQAAREAWDRHREVYAGDFVVDESTDEPVPYKSRWRVRSLYAVAAAAVLALAVVLITPLFRPKGGKPVSEVSVKNGSRTRMLLPDGSQVWLNAGSKLVYGSNMAEENERIVTLEGEAFFDVAKNPDKPFLIKTSKITIRVLGTTLNVKAYPADTATEATLITGKVQVNINQNPEQRIVLAPMEKFILNEVTVPPAANGLNSAKQYTVADIRPVYETKDSIIYQETAWVKNQLVFNNETLAELAPKLERWYGIEIDINSQNSGSHRYTGIFDKETVEQAFRAMQLVKPFKYAIEGNKVTIH